jgi:hypothetical protein
MLKVLAPLLGKHKDSPEFKAMLSEHFPDFVKFNSDKQYKDKKTKIVLILDSLSMYDDDAPISEDPNDYLYFTSFFFGKDESEIPFGVSAKDDEATVIKKAGKPTHHNKVLEGPMMMLANDLHYHIDKYKMTVAFDPATGENYGQIGFMIRLKGQKF